MKQQEQERIEKLKEKQIKEEEYLKKLMEQRQQELQTKAQDFKLKAVEKLSKVERFFFNQSKRLIVLE